jgi:2-polyprenyl-3-methyl-5-hydroxy-6-metoxy-1,4-benzoquinol methylase
MSQSACRACGSLDLAPYETMNAGGQQLSLLECTACRSYSYYPEPRIDYTTHTSDPEMIRRYLEIEASVDWLCVNVMTAIGDRKNGRLLDIGCGFGFSADAARRLAGWTVTGVEPSVWGRRGAEILGLEILNEFIDESHPLAAHRFDVIHCSEVIEHIASPCEFATFLRGLLAQRGTLALTTPDASALRRPISESMRQAILSIGAHVVLFSAQSLEQLLRRAGFRHVQVAVRDCTLIAFASDEPLALSTVEPVPLGIAYTRAVLASGPTHPALISGMQSRLFRHLVELGRYEEAEVALRGLETHLHPPGAPGRNDKTPYFIGTLNGYAGYLYLNHKGDQRRARDLFLWSFEHCRRQVELTPHTAVFDQSIMWRSLFHTGLCSELLGDTSDAHAIYARIVEASRTPGEVPPDILERALAALPERPKMQELPLASAVRTSVLSSAKAVLYTAIFGDYDEAPAVAEPDPELRYVLFSDKPIAAPSPWELRIVPRIFADPQRDARRLKLLPHLLFPEHEISAWLDANCAPKGLTAARILELLDKADIAASAHEDRRCLYDEAAVVLAAGGYDSPARVTRQMGRYRALGMPEGFGLHATMFMLRRHNSPSCIRFAHSWWSEVSAYSKRDQLSFDMVRWTNPGTEVRTLDIRYTNNALYRWGRTGSGGHATTSKMANEHLLAATSTRETPSPALVAAYRAEYELWPKDFISRLYALNGAVAATGEPLEGNLCYFNNERHFRDTPPDPRRGARREIFLRSICTARRMFEIGFNAGHSALLALTHYPALHVTSIDLGRHAYTHAAAAHLSRTYPDRLDFHCMNSTDLFDRARALGLREADVVHIDGGHDAPTAASDILTVASAARPGALVLIDDIYVDAIRHPADWLVSAGHLRLMDDLAGYESACYELVEPLPLAGAGDLQAHISRLLADLPQPH